MFGLANRAVRDLCGQSPGPGRHRRQAGVRRSVDMETVAREPNEHHRILLGGCVAPHGSAQLRLRLQTGNDLQRANLAPHTIQIRPATLGLPDDGIERQSFRLPQFIPQLLPGDRTVPVPHPLANFIFKSRIVCQQSGGSFGKRLQKSACDLDSILFRKLQHSVQEFVGSLRHALFPQVVCEN